MKEDENPEMLLVHCVIHGENLVSNYITPVRPGWCIGQRSGFVIRR